jgi:hypothetical protein
MQLLCWNQQHQNKNCCSAFTANFSCGKHHANACLTHPGRGTATAAPPPCWYTIHTYTPAHTQAFQARAQRARITHAPAMQTATHCISTPHRGTYGHPCMLSDPPQKYTAPVCTRCCDTWGPRQNHHTQQYAVLHPHCLALLHQPATPL